MIVGKYIRRSLNLLSNFFSNTKTKFSKKMAEITDQDSSEELNELQQILDEADTKEKKEKGNYLLKFEAALENHREFLNPQKFERWNKNYEDVRYKKRILQNMLDMFVKEELYKKCANVRDWIAKINEKN